MIKVSAPGKLLLFGEHAVVHSKPCIVTAVDQRMEVEADFNGENKLIINAPQLGIKNYHKEVKNLGSQEMPKQVSFIEAAVKRFYLEFGLGKGVKITTHSQFCYTFGFGSSSAVTIASLKALSKLYKVKLSNKKLFDLAYKTVLDIQKVGSGFDLAAALWGGTLFFKKGAKIVKPLNLKNLPLIVCYSGIKADTPTLVRQVYELKRKKPEKIKNIFNKIEDIALKAEKSLKQEDWQKTGRLMNQNQKLLENLGVSTRKLEKLIKAAKNSGALGAKLSGAGGGDNIIVLATKNKEKIKKALKNSGGRIMDVKINAKGVKWR
jgi:mevalonate kinase